VLRAHGPGPKLVLVSSGFDRIDRILDECGYPVVDGVLFDLGVSSHQLDEPSRGFSFKDPGAPLDMRMNQEEATPTAAELANSLSEDELTRLLRDNADERWAARIAEFIITRRKQKPYSSVGQMVETVLAAVPTAARSRDIHPATRTFQAFRIAVNNELEGIGHALRQVVPRLKTGGRIAVISYHSGEDRIVKNTLASLAGKCECPPRQPVCTCGAGNPLLFLLTKKPRVADDSEIAGNLRARSAKLRVAERRGLI
jgi:16S rRNA (cytosine1402-N4)-methyltransferase